MDKWSVHTSPSSHPPTSSQVDVRSGESIEWIANPNNEAAAYVGEPVFVPAPNSAAEDDGVVLCVVDDAVQRRAFVAVLNATTMSELARVWADVHVPFGFHTQFVAARAT